MTVDNTAGASARRPLCQPCIQDTGLTVSWSVASANRTLDGHIRAGTEPALLEQIDQNVLALLHEVEGLCLDDGLDVKKLRTFRNLLIKTAHSLALKAERVSELRLLALTDDLTGFYNRRAFLALATQQLKVSRRNSQPMLLFFVDVDNLKYTNDVYGHAEGDALLLRCASVLRKTFRESDIVARLGGDEFAVLAPDGADQSCQTVLKRLLQVTRDINSRGTRVQLSLSVGTVGFDPQNPVSLAELLTVADRDMYQQKRRRGELAELGSRNE